MFFILMEDFNGYNMYIYTLWESSMMNPEIWMLEEGKLKTYCLN